MTDFREKDLPEKDFDREKTVFVSNVPPAATHSQIFSYFSDYGTVKKVYVPKSKPNQPPRCFAFVTFDTVEQAEEVLTIGEREGLYFDDAQLYVEKNKKPTKATEDKREKEKESYRKRTATSALAPVRDPIFGDPLSVGFSVEYQTSRKLKTADLPPKALEKKEVAVEKEKENRSKEREKEGERDKQKPKERIQQKKSSPTSKRESNPQDNTTTNTNTAPSNGTNNITNQATNQTSSALHFAIVQQRDEEVFMLLLQRHDPNSRDDSGRTALDLALNVEEQLKRKGVSIPAKLTRIITTLISYGAKTNLMPMPSELRQNQKSNQNENQNQNQNQNHNQNFNHQQHYNQNYNYHQHFDQSTKSQPVNIKQNPNPPHNYNQHQIVNQTQRNGMEILELLKQVNLNSAAADQQSPNQQNNAPFSPHSAAFFPQQQQQQQQQTPVANLNRSSPKTHRNSTSPNQSHSFFPSSDMNASYGAPLHPSQQPYAYPYAYVPAGYYYPPEVMATNFFIPQTTDQTQFAPQAQLPPQQFGYYFNQSYS
eukprot:TRINITY_DN123_c0_g4_i1.p1 TRINITY_DN123_c0_g4~~TRINITY_DN123_c0_g4_i1.p1  ORF type:complete len:538 (-),score=153.82 TRINITY_DN123_c0_g4_i1:76-1689(-)